MIGNTLTPETYDKLLSNGYRYMALDTVNMSAKNETVEFIFTVLKHMPFSFATSLTSISDAMIKGVVFGQTENISIRVQFPDTEIAAAA